MDVTNLRLFQPGRPRIALHGARRLRRLALCWVVALGCLPQPAAAEILSGRDFEKLLASGPEGTTIVFQGGADKVFYSPALKNALRQSRALGTEFLRQQIQHNTIAEGTFVSAMIQDGKWKTISGISGIAVDQESGHGVLTLIQSFPEDRTIEAFEKRDRLFSTMIVEETVSGILCRRSRWEKLSAFKGQNTMSSAPCEFTVGNTITPAAHP
jgi:hypothetical protein